MLQPKKRMLVLGVLFAVGGAAAGIVYAAIPSGNVISACYNPTSGYALRVIDDTVTNCKAGERRLEMMMRVGGSF